MAEFDEIDFGEWQGMSFDELRGDPRWARFNRRRGATPPPRGEPARATRERFLRGLRRLLAERPLSCIAVVSHGDPIRYALTGLLGLPFDSFVRLTVDPAAVSAVAWDGGDGARPLCLNRAERIVPD